MTRKFAPIFCLLLAASCCHAQAPEQRLAADVAKRVDAAVQAEIDKQQLVGVSIGVIQNGNIVYLKAYGLADREKRIPTSIETIFNWASNSKPMCATAAMQLVEKKQLDLDVDIRKYVPEFPAKEGTITMRHILCHESGIQHYGNVQGTKRTYTMKLPQLDPVNSLDVFNRTPLVFKPGEKVMYSSYAYILASAVVERAGKESYTAQIEKRIAKPLGLKSLQLDMDFSNQPYWSVGYIKKSDTISRAAEEAHYWKHGAGGYKSNVIDFAKWAQAIINHRLLTTEAEKTMWTRQKTNDGKLTAWGLGFTVADENSFKVSHSGKQDESTTNMVLYPTAKHGVVVMTNCGFGNTGALTTAIYKALNTK